MKHLFCLLNPATARLPMLLLVAALPLVLTSCIKAVESRGYTFEDVNISKLQTGKSTKAEVLQVLGSPSSQSSFGKETWFYVSSKADKVAFLTPKTIEQEVIAIEFNSGGYIDALNKYTLADAKLVQYAKETTPTEGSDTSAVGQILGNVGRFNPAGGGIGRTTPHNVPGQ